MKTQRGIRRAVAAAFLAGSFACGTAWASAMDAAQPLTFDGAGMATVTDTVSGGSAMVYSFWAKGGDVVTVDVDGASIDTILSVHTPAPEYTVDRVVDDSPIIDEGSVWPLDPLIQSWVVPADGVYYAAVTVAPDRVADGGVFVPVGGAGSGDFTLVVSGVSPAPAGGTPGPTTETPPAEDPLPQPEEASTPIPEVTVQQVRIDIRPGRRALVRLNPKWKKVIPVAILSSRDFDAADIDPSSLTFGRTGEEQSLRNCNKHLTRANRDRRRDLVCYFQNADAAFELGDEEGVLKGMTNNGMAFEGRGMLKVLPEKRHWGHRHGKGHRKHADNDRRHRGHRH